MQQENPVKYISIRRDISAAGRCRSKGYSRPLNVTSYRQRSHQRYHLGLGHPENDTMLYNEGILQYTGLQQTRNQWYQTWWEGKYYKDDIRYITDTIDETFAAKKTTGTVWTVSRSENGIYKHIFDQGICFYTTAKGKAYRMIGAMQDITYKRRKSTALPKQLWMHREAERQYLGMELHDNINQLLTGTVLMLGAASHALWKKKRS